MWFLDDVIKQLCLLDILPVILKGLQVPFKSGICPQAYSSPDTGTLDQLARCYVAPQTAVTA